MSTETTTATTDDDSTDDNDYWAVSYEGVTLQQIRYSQYELSHGSLTVEFDSIREHDDGTYTLRDDHDTLATFDPTVDSVPSIIETAFRVLASEL